MEIGWYKGKVVVKVEMEVPIKKNGHNFPTTLKKSHPLKRLYLATLSHQTTLNLRIL